MSAGTWRTSASVCSTFLAEALAADGAGGEHERKDGQDHQREFSVPRCSKRRIGGVLVENPFT